MHALGFVLSNILSHLLTFTFHGDVSLKVKQCLEVMLQIKVACGFVDFRMCGTRWLEGKTP